MVAPQPDQDGSSGLAVVTQPKPLPMQTRGPRLGLPSAAELATLREYGNIVIASGIAPSYIRKAETAIVIMRYGHQLGIDEFTALQNMFVIDGKVAMFASLMHAVVLRDHGGDAITPKEISAERVTLKCQRKGSPDSVIVSYTMEEAKQAKLATKDTWQKYPADMLFARCISRAGRQVFRDSTLGMYVPEEIGANYIEVQGEVVRADGPEYETEPGTESDLDRAMRALHAAGNDKSADHQVLHDLAEAAYGVASLKECTAGQLRGLEQVIIACEIPDIQMVIAYARELDACRAMECLDEIAGRVATETLPKRALDFLTFIGKRVQGNLSAPAATPADDSIQDATFVDVTETPPAFDEAAAAWRDRVEAAHMDTDLGRSSIELANLIAEAGDDPARWDVLLALSPTQNRLNSIRGAHIKTGAKDNQANIATYQRRTNELKAKATAGK